MEQPAYLSNGCGVSGMVSESLAGPATSKENKALAVAREMEVRLQGKPGLEMEASREAKGWISGATVARPRETSPVRFQNPTFAHRSLSLPPTRATKPPSSQPDVMRHSRNASREM